MHRSAHKHKLQADDMNHNSTQYWQEPRLPVTSVSCTFMPPCMASEPKASSTLQDSCIKN